MNIAVVYATLGRPDIVAGALSAIRDQTRAPDLVVVSAHAASDIPDLGNDADIDVVFGPKGLPAQRNAGLRAIKARAASCDVVVFFDDDFAPSPTFLANLERLFDSDPDLAGATGHVIADGIGGPGYTFEEARRFLDAFRPPSYDTSKVKRVGSLYGCNMAIRLSLAHDLTFDETLPLYAWQEDVDFSVQLGRRGPLVWSAALIGVHLGVKRARTPGLSMGYAQIANPIFLRRKKTMSIGHAYSLMGKNLAANLVKSLHPEPWCDRRGRLAGNVRALRDLVGRRLHPQNIVGLK